MSEMDVSAGKRSRFNPAYFARRVAREDEDGNVYYEKDLPLSARLLWMYSDRPGWRITSDGYSVMNLKDENGMPTYFVHGHVAVIDEQGVRIASYPVSTSVESPDFAVQWFEVGTATALNFLGFNVHNITMAQWAEALALQADVGSDYKPEGFEPPESMRGERVCLGQFNAVEDPGRLRPAAAIPDLDEQLPTEGDAPEDSPLLDRAMDLAVLICRSDNPESSQNDVQGWFDKILFKCFGAPNWESISENEQAEVLQYLRNMAGKKGLV